MGLDSETAGSHEGRVIRAVAWPAFWFEISLWLHVGERKLGDYGGDKRVDGCPGRSAGQPGSSGNSAKKRDLQRLKRSEGKKL